MSQVFDVMSDFWKGTYHWESWQTNKGHVDNDFVQRRRRWWCRWFRGKRRRRWCIFAFSQIGLPRERANGNLCHIKGLKKALHQNVVSLSPGRDYMWKSGTSDPPAASVKGGIGGLCVGDMSSPSVFAQGGALLQLLPSSFEHRYLHRYSTDISRCIFLQIFAPNI